MPALAAVDAGGLWQVFVGVMAGVLLIAALDRFVPHLHGLAGLDRTGSAGGRSSLDKVLLFVLAIAIHKFPEGIAAGVVFDDSADLSNAYAVSVAIAPAEHSGRDGRGDPVAHGWSKLCAHCGHSSP